MDTQGLKTILVATDLSETSDELLRSAATLARASGAAIFVLHSFDLAPLPGGERQPADHSFFGRIEAATAALREQVERTVPHDVRVMEQRVEIYVAHRAIIEWAAVIGADLIVLGPHTWRQAEVGLLGTTADAVVRQAAVPCLVVRRPLVLPLGHVVVPVDLSASAQVSVRVAADWRGRLGRREPAGEPSWLHVVHVLPARQDGEALEANEALVGSSLRHEVGQVLQRQGAEGPPADVRLLRNGRPADAVLEFAEETGADLIVLATHGYGLVKRALFGWTASAVARRAPCSVLLVPPRLWQAEHEDEFADATADEGVEDRMEMGTGSAAERVRWPEILQTFTLRNAARMTRLEELHPSLGAQMEETSRPLRGATFDPHDEQVELMFGELGGADGHLTRSISRVTSVDVLTGEDGRDRALRIAHREGQTILTFAP